MSFAFGPKLLAAVCLTVLMGWTLLRGGCLSAKLALDGCEEWKAPCEKPVSFALTDDFGAKDCEYLCPKLGALAIDSVVCIPSMCGGSEMLSRGFAESTAVLSAVDVRVLIDRTKQRRA